MIEQLSLKARIIMLMVGVALISTIVSLWAAQRNAELAIWEQVNKDGELVGTIIAETIAMSREIPDKLEESLERDMTSTARLMAEYVALAERAGVSRRDLQQVLDSLAANLGIAEIWITDSTGKVVISVPKDTPFTFSPEPDKQPQASEFWPLLTGQAQVVAQLTQRRDLDGAFFKYVGVTGVDRPRIVQLGIKREQVEEVRSRLSIARLNDALVRSGVLVKPLLVVDGQLKPIDQLITPESARAGVEVDRIAPHIDLLKQALSSGTILSRMEAKAAVIYSPYGSPYGSQDGSFQGAFVAAFPRYALDHLLAQQRKTILIIGAVVFAAASALGWFVSTRLTRRLAVISRAARELQEGRFDRLQELQRFAGQRDEIGRLGQVVHKMGHEVRNRQTILESEVRKRTEELATQNEALAASQAVISGELELAKQLQLGILPESFPPCSGYRGAARVRMQQQMGGDFYDFIKRPDGAVAMVMADVSGKGITAAFFMAMARTSLAEQLTQGHSLDVCLSRTNDVLCRSNPLDLFVTVFVALLDPRSGLIQYANAGHNPPIVMSAGDQVGLLPTRGELALGVLEEQTYTLDTLELAPGHALLAYTDGVTEAFNSLGQAYGEDRLIQWARQSDGNASVDQRLSALFEEVISFQGTVPQSDDITMALIQRVQEDRPAHSDEPAAVSRHSTHG